MEDKLGEADTASQTKTSWETSPGGGHSIPDQMEDKMGDKTGDKRKTSPEGEHSISDQLEDKMGDKTGDKRKTSSGMRTQQFRQGGYIRKALRTPTFLTKV